MFGESLIENKKVDGSKYKGLTKYSFISKEREIRLAMRGVWGIEAYIRVHL